MKPQNNKIICFSEEAPHQLLWAKSLQGKPFEIYLAPLEQKLNLSTYAAHNYGLAVLDTKSLNQPEINKVLEVANFFKSIFTLVLAEQITIRAYQQLTQIKDLITLQKPFELDLLSTLAGKLMLSSEVPDGRQRFPRFITDEPARMMVMKSGLLITTRMKNYSAGGAFLEYKGISLRPGDRIQVNLLSNDQLQIGSNKTKKNLLIHAKVVWIKNGDNPRSPGRGVGVQFEKQVT